MIEPVGCRSAQVGRWQMARMSHQHADRRKAGKRYEKCPRKRQRMYATLHHNLNDRTGGFNAEDGFDRVGNRVDEVSWLHLSLRCARLQ